MEERKMFDQRGISAESGKLPLEKLVRLTVKEERGAAGGGETSFRGNDRPEIII
ncbi:hypothetical protein WN51_07035 [Melipona quadrifasciata]|uniref:Uncharacterized protein n=1 Tax=Melipona quadrifasciata TaxID=166423 RepID=A0A0M8ZP88_9HYME|nr:hypothetical protein WN51_07035 [Melipona quadrifasciata]